jgi:hypothetical protein
MGKTGSQPENSLKTLEGNLKIRLSGFLPGLLPGHDTPLEPCFSEKLPGQFGWRCAPLWGSDLPGGSSGAASAAQ